MKRLFFGKEQIPAVATSLFGERDDFDLGKFMKYEELELVLQEDGRFSLWGNLPDDTDLLRDTRKDSAGKVEQLAFLAQRVIEEEDEPVDGEEEPNLDEEQMRGE